jgi:hypothetical protein
LGKKKVEKELKKGSIHPKKNEFINSKDFIGYTGMKKYSFFH